MAAWMNTAADWVAVITAILTPLTVIVVAYLNSKKVEAVRLIGAQNLVNTTAIDRAVNGKDPRESTISEDVSTIMAKQEVDSPSATLTNGGALLPLVKQLTTDLAAVQAQIAGLAVESRRQS